MQILRNSSDGFEIAEKDLELRGGGAILSEKQTGVADFRFFDFVNHKDIIHSVIEETSRVMEGCTSLQEFEKKNPKLMVLLNAFEHCKKINFLNG